MKRVFTFEEVTNLLLFALVTKGELKSGVTYSFGVDTKANSLEFSITESNKPVTEPVKKFDDFGDEIEDVTLDDE